MHTCVQLLPAVLGPPIRPLLLLLVLSFIILFCICERSLQLQLQRKKKTTAACRLQLQQGRHSTADICRRRKKRETERRKRRKGNKKEKVRTACLSSLDPQGCTKNLASQFSVFNQTATETASFHYSASPGQAPNTLQRNKSSGQSWITRSDSSV